MNTDHYAQRGDPPRPEGDPAAGQVRDQARNMGVRRVRHISNWTAAALLVGTGAATVALASHALPASSSSAASTYAAGGTSVPGVRAPHVGGAVATSGGSGATVTTTTHMVNGKPVITQTRHPAVYHDH